MTINLEKMRSRLTGKREELLNSIAGLTEAHPKVVSSIEAHEGPQDFEEAAVDFLEMQHEQSILANEQALLQEVGNALKRIEDGTYGRCIDCGQPIADKRLEALPWASRCVKDEGQLEREILSRRELFSSQEDKRMLS
jgi:DnaK suppressor protein